MPSDGQILDQKRPLNIKKQAYFRKKYFLHSKKYRKKGLFLGKNTSSFPKKGPKTDQILKSQAFFREKQMKQRPLVVKFWTKKALWWSNFGPKMPSDGHILDQKRPLAVKF